MKYFKVFLFSLAFTAFFAACGGNSSHSHDQGATTPAQTEDANAEQGPEYTSAYICPMHCKGSGSDSAGTCPVCGMDYVKNENAATDGAKGTEHMHEDGEGHEGHSH